MSDSSGFYIGGFGPPPRKKDRTRVPKPDPTFRVKPPRKLQLEIEVWKYCWRVVSDDSSVLAFFWISRPFLYMLHTFSWKETPLILLFSFATSTVACFQVRPSTSITGCVRLSVGRSVGIAFAFDDPHGAPYWPTWPCFLHFHWFWRVCKFILIEEWAIWVNG